MITLEKTDVLGLAAAVHAAVESGLLSEVAVRGGITAAEAAASLKLDLVATERVLGVLVSAHLLAWEAGVYVLDPELEAMHRALPGGLVTTALLFSTTSAFLRSGAPFVSMDGGLAERAEAYRTTVGGLAVLFERAAQAFAASFVAHAGPALPSAPRVLDVGCGAGVWGLTLASLLPGARLTGLDLPGVLDVFRAAAKERASLLPVTAIEGDLWQAELPESDVVLLANVLRLEPAPRAEALLTRLSRAVAPGGALVVVDALAHGSSERDVARAVYALHLALRTRSASAHAPSEVAAWLASAGLMRIAPLDFGAWPGAVAAMVGWRGPT